MIRMTVYAGPGLNGDHRDASTVHRDIIESEVSEELFKLGKEYSTADYFPTRQVVITLDPVKPDLEKHQEEIKKLVGQAFELLEQTGLI